MPIINPDRERKSGRRWVGAVAAAGCVLLGAAIAALWQHREFNWDGYRYIMGGDVVHAAGMPPITYEHNPLAGGGDEWTCRIGPFEYGVWRSRLYYPGKMLR